MKMELKTNVLPMETALTERSVVLIRFREMAAARLYANHQWFSVLSMSSVFVLLLGWVTTPVVGQKSI